MAKGHLLINPASRSQDDDPPPRQSCCRQLTIGDAAILLSGIQLAIAVGYLLHLTTSYDADLYHAQKMRVYIFMGVVPVMIAVVMLTVFGIVGKRLWMLVPNVLAQLALVGVFIAAIVVYGGVVSSFQQPVLPENGQNGAAITANKAYLNHYALAKSYLAWSIVGLVLTVIGSAVMILCFVFIYRSRNDTAAADKYHNGY